MSNTHYILIDATTRKPVPLPFHTTYIRDDNGEERPATVYNVSLEPGVKRLPIRFWTDGALEVSFDGGPTKFGVDPQRLDLAIITEADFMAEQEDAN